MIASRLADDIRPYKLSFYIKIINENCEFINLFGHYIQKAY